MRLSIYDNDTQYHCICQEEKQWRGNLSNTMERGRDSWFAMLFSGRRRKSEVRRRRQRATVISQKSEGERQKAEEEGRWKKAEDPLVFTNPHTASSNERQCANDVRSRTVTVTILRAGRPDGRLRSVNGDSHRLRGVNSNFWCEIRVKSQK